MHLHFWSDCSKKKKRKKIPCSLVIPVKSFWQRYTWLFPPRGFYILEIDCQFSLLQDEIWLAIYYIKPLPLLTLKILSQYTTTHAQFGGSHPICSCSRTAFPALSSFNGEKQSFKKRYRYHIHSVVQERWDDTRETRGALGTMRPQLMGAPASV